MGGRAECEPRATPLSTRSILRRIPTFRSPFFSFSVVPPGRPPPFPTVCSFTIFFFLLFFVSPLFNTEKTRSKNRGGEDASSHPTHPWGPTLKKKSVAKAKIFFLLIALGRNSVSFADCHTEQNSDGVYHSQNNPVVASLFDRSELVYRRWVGKNFGWVAARPQPKRRTKCETPVACEKLHFAISWGPLPLYFTQKTHTKTQNQTVPDLPEWVRSADAGRTTQPPAETQIYLTYWRGGSGGQYIFGLIRSQLWLSPFRIGADLSLLSYHVFWANLAHMLAGA